MNNQGKGITHTEQQHCHVADDVLYGIRHAELYSADTEQCLRFFLMMTLIYTLNKRQCHSTQCLPPATNIIKKYIIYNWKFKLDKFYN